jgi:hypothetical protein
MNQGLWYGRPVALSQPAPQPPVLTATAAHAPPAPTPVKIHILVIEADKKAEHFDKRLEPFRKAMPGYKGAKLLDELDASAEEGASVSLEILRQSGKSRLLRVTVQDVGDTTKTVKLKVAIDALKFSTVTTHKNGATLVVGHPLSGDKALFLAVTPKV